MRHIGEVAYLMLGWLLRGHESAKEWALLEAFRAVKAYVDALRGLKVL